MIIFVCKQKELHKIKKGTFSLAMLNVYPKLFGRHLIHMRIKCHFFITTIIMIRRNKMIVMYRRTLIIKFLFFIIIKPPLYKRFGRHSTTDIPYENYTIKQLYKQANK